MRASPGAGVVVAGLAGVLLAGATCARPSSMPAGPSAPTGQTGAEPFSLCHRLESGAFVLMTVEQTAATAHLAHGDNWLGDTVPGQPGKKFGAGCLIEAIVETTITFAGLTVNHTPVTHYEEAGFVVAGVSGPWESMSQYGAPKPAVIFVRPTSEPTMTAEMAIRSGNALFGFASVQIYSSVTPIPYEVLGVRRSVALFHLAGTIPNTFGHFVPLINPDADLRIDTLVIRLSNPATPCCANPVGFDTVVLRR